MTPLSASILGSTTVATPINSCSAWAGAAICSGDGILRRLDYDRRCRICFALRLRLPVNFHDGGLERDHHDHPGRAADREHSTAQRFNLDFAVQEVLRKKGCARDDVRLDYRLDCLPALLSQEPLEHAGGQLVKCFIEGGENCKGPLTLEYLNHARGLKQVQEAGEPAVLLRGLDDVGGLRGPSALR